MRRVGMFTLQTDMSEGDETQLYEYQPLSPLPLGWISTLRSISIILIDKHLDTTHVMHEIETLPDCRCDDTLFPAFLEALWQTVTSGH